MVQGRRISRRPAFVRRSHPPSAVFVSSDVQAIGLLLAVNEIGLRVPDDVAMVSFDGTEASAYTFPKLTVVRQPVQPMAVDAVDRVLAATGQVGRGYIVHQPELIVRASCGWHAA